MTKLLMMDLLSLPLQDTEIFPCEKLLSHLFPVRETSITIFPANVSRNAIYAMLKLNPKKLETLPSALYCRKLQPVLWRGHHKAHIKRQISTPPSQLQQKIA